MKHEIKNTIEQLKKGNTILYPTDTVWGIGCDATNEAAVKKIFELKQRAESKSLIILVDSLEMLTDIVDEVPDQVLQILENPEKPTTFILKNPKGMAKNIIAKDNTLAIRIADDTFCKKLIKEFQKPIVSTSANISGDSTPMAFKEIHPVVLEGVDYVVNLRQNEISSHSSRIIKILDDGTIQVLRD